MMNDMSLKAKLRNIAKVQKLPAQLVLQNYLFERFLYRLSVSEYAEKFVIKGGTLISAIVGLSNRATMDLDTTLKGLPLTPESIEAAIRVVCAISTDDGLLFSYQRIEPIREDDVYGGYRAFLTAQFGKINAPLSIDITTGDVMTPAAELRAFPTMFEADSFSLWTYNNETILAEKVETILSRSVFSTRPRDFYDVYILSRSVSYDPELFRKALVATAAHRDSTEQIANPAPILVRISESDALKRLWDNYRRQFSYAADVEYADVIEAITNLLK